MASCDFRASCVRLRLERMALTFHVVEGRPTPDGSSVIDGPDDYFRIRLVCTLLDTCGVYFDRGLLRKKMDNFLTFFQMYAKTKRQPAPMDIDFMLSDTFETLRPKFVQYAGFEEAAKAVDDMFAKASVQSGSWATSMNRADCVCSHLCGSRSRGGAGRRDRRWRASPPGNES